MRYSLCACRTFFADKGQTPRKDVHKIWQPIGMWAAVKLPDVHHVVFILQDGRLCKFNGIVEIHIVKR